jgi:hypothetical protein
LGLLVPPEVPETIRRQSRVGRWCSGTVVSSLAQPHPSDTRGAAEPKFFETIESELAAKRRQSQGRLRPALFVSGVLARA